MIDSEAIKAQKTACQNSVSFVILEKKKSSNTDLAIQFERLPIRQSQLEAVTLDGPLLHKTKLDASIDHRSNASFAVFYVGHVHIALLVHEYIVILRRSCRRGRMRLGELSNRHVSVQGKQLLGNPRLGSEGEMRIPYIWKRGQRGISGDPATHMAIGPIPLSSSRLGVESRVIKTQERPRSSFLQRRSVRVLIPVQAYITTG